MEKMMARLVANAIRQRVRNIRFGLLARSLPPFDAYTLYESLKPDLNNLRLALIGFEDGGDYASVGIATNVEKAVEWRNDLNISVPIVVILNAAVQQEKIHSLELLEPFTDQDLRRAICKQGENEAKDDPLQKQLWHNLRLTTLTDRIPLVASQAANLYHALQNHNIADVLPHIGLLPDPHLIDYKDPNERFVGRLKKNREHVEWLLALDNQAYRTIARALPSTGSSEHSQTFQKIKQFAQDPTLDQLSRLTLDAVVSIREAKKAPETLVTSTDKGTEKTTSTARRQFYTPDIFLVDQLLTLDPAKPENQQKVENIEAQAERISEMFYGELSDDYEEDQNRASFQSDNLRDRSNDEEQYEVLVDPETNEEITSIKLPTDDDDLHPLDEYMGIGSVWLHPHCWGGHVRLEKVPEGVVDVADLFNGSVALPFKPLQPLNTHLDSSLLNLFSQLEEHISEPTEASNLTNLFQELHKHRRYLANYRRQFLYHPNWAISTPELQRNIEGYLTTYDRLAQRLQQVCRQVQAVFPDAVERAAAQFLALDVVIIDIPPDNLVPQSQNVILTTLHPLHLWKWYRLGKLIKNNQRNLTEREIEQINKAAQYLPTLLNTFLLHNHMFDPPRHLIEPRLVFAGEINNPKSDTTVGIPYYKPVAHQSPISDGLQQFVNLFNQFLVLYPPARLGLTLVLIDPLQLSPILQKLAKLHNENVLHGARIYVYHTDEQTPVHDDWQSKDDEALDLFRENPRWALSVSLEHNTLTAINQHLQNEEIYPHIVLLCDPSEAVVQSIFRTVQEEVSPFGIPVQITYDRISDTIKLTPTPGGDVFDAYAGVRTALSGELQRSVLGVGNRHRSNIELKDVHLLLDDEQGANWLAIIDRLHGTLELPSDVGRRLAWQRAGSRVLAIHTNERDWKNHWAQHLTYKVNDFKLPGKIEASYILDRLLELFSILPDGLITLIKKSINEDYDAFLEDELTQLLGVIALLNWYRQDKAGLILIPINGGQDDNPFADWYGDQTMWANNNYMALWLDAEGFHADILTLNSYLDTFESSEVSNLSQRKQSLNNLSQFASNLDTLFFNDDQQTILAPLRRALLREKLTAAVFAASQPETSDVLAQSKETKAQWAKAINELFTIAYKPHIRLLDIRVALRERYQLSDIHLYRSDSDDYQRVTVKLPATFLQTSLMAEKKSPKWFDQLDLSQLQDKRVRKRRKEHKPRIDPAVIPVTRKHPTPKPVPNDVIAKQAEQLRSVLIAYGIAIAGVDVEKSQVGPLFIRYWVKLQPPAGRLSEIQRYAEDIARELGSKTVPFIDNIPGERYVGIDLARDEPEVIPLTSHLDELPTEQNSQLFIALGQNPAGEGIQLDLARLPHMLVAGSTGSGKTVFLSSLIISLVWRHTKNDLSVLLVDPKQTDFGVFGELPHLYDNQIFYEPEEAIIALRQLIVHEKDSRTKTLCFY